MIEETLRDVLAGVIEEPTDYDRRLILADALTDADCELQAEFIRNHVEMFRWGYPRAICEAGSRDHIGDGMYRADVNDIHGRELRVGDRVDLCVVRKRKDVRRHGMVVRSIKDHPSGYPNRRFAIVARDEWSVKFDRRRWEELSDRVEELWNAHVTEWFVTPLLDALGAEGKWRMGYGVGNLTTNISICCDLARGDKSLQFVVRGGLIEELHLPMLPWWQCGKALARAFPLTKVEITDRVASVEDWSCGFGSYNDDTFARCMDSDRIPLTLYGMLNERLLRPEPRTDQEAEPRTDQEALGRLNEVSLEWAKWRE